jgi:hypothetical protein
MRTNVFLVILGVIVQEQEEQQLRELVLVDTTVQVLQ